MTFRNGETETKKSFLRSLNEAWLKGGLKYGRKKIPYNTFEATEDGLKADLFYWHIEAYGEVTGTNSAVILLISRIDAEIAAGNANDIESILSGFEAVCRELSAIGKANRRIENADVFNLLSKYREQVS